MIKHNFAGISGNYLSTTDALLVCYARLLFPSFENNVDPDQKSGPDRLASVGSTQFPKGFSYNLVVKGYKFKITLQSRERSGSVVLDSRPSGRGFEPHRRHCVVVLEQDTFIIA